MGHLTLFIDALATEFYEWFKFYTELEAPIEGDANGGYCKWTQAELSQDEDSPIWVRCYVDVITEAGNKPVTRNGEALMCCMTQIRKTGAPRLEMLIHWDDTFSGSAWAFITKIAQAYPETADAITEWKRTDEGIEAGVCNIANRWLEDARHFFIEQVLNEILKTSPDTVITNRDDLVAAWVTLTEEQQERLDNDLNAFSRQYRNELQEIQAAGDVIQEAPKSGSEQNEDLSKRRGAYNTMTRERAEDIAKVFLAHEKTQTLKAALGFVEGVSKYMYEKYKDDPQVKASVERLRGDTAFMTDLDKWAQYFKN